jgi:hypothetical protein
VVPKDLLEDPELLEALAVKEMLGHLVHQEVLVLLEDLDQLVTLEQLAQLVDKVSQELLVQLDVWEPQDGLDLVVHQVHREKGAQLVLASWQCRHSCLKQKTKKRK